jgi:hypothetical protein
MIHGAGVTLTKNRQSPALVTCYLYLFIAPGEQTTITQLPVLSFRSLIFSLVQCTQARRQERFADCSVKSAPQNAPTLRGVFLTAAWSNPYAPQDLLICVTPRLPKLDSIFRRQTFTSWLCTCSQAMTTIKAFAALSQIHESMMSIASRTADTDPSRGLMSSRGNGSESLNVPSFPGTKAAAIRRDHTYHFINRRLRSRRLCTFRAGADQLLNIETVTLPRQQCVP